MAVMFKVMCINDKDRPESIPTSKWIKEKEIYTVIEVSKMLIQGGQLGFKLREVNIDDCFPYQYFSAKRFALVLPKELEGSSFAEKLLNDILEEAKEDFTRSFS